MDCPENSRSAPGFTKVLRTFTKRLRLGVGTPPAPLSLRLAPLSLEALLDRALARARRPARAFDGQGVAQRGAEALDGELPVAPLASLVLRKRVDDRARLGNYPGFLAVSQRG